MGAHLSAFVGAWLAIAFVGPLVVWLVKRDEDPFVAEHAKEALNFNLTFLIALVVSVILMFVLIGFVLIAIVAIAWIILTIVAAVKANNGEHYRYPMTIRFIS
ncbi:MAG: DUF4870 domain-containing protein [Nitriliruptorales bacterium]|nr:DUF4870 domain-containing protein [Nitriliruptorales bacterium]